MRDAKRPRGTILAKPLWCKRRLAAGQVVPTLVAFAEVDGELTVVLDLTRRNTPRVDSNVPHEAADLALKAWAKFVVDGYGEWELWLASLRLNPPSDLSALDEVALQG